MPLNQQRKPVFPRSACQRVMSLLGSRRTGNATGSFRQEYQPADRRIGCLPIRHGYVPSNSHTNNAPLHFQPSKGITFVLLWSCSARISPSPSKSIITRPTSEPIFYVSFLII